MLPWFSQEATMITSICSSRYLEWDLECEKIHVQQIEVQLLKCSQKQKQRLRSVSTFQNKILNL